ncbi:MAG: hypothetical protein H0T14_04830 [Nocardioidaceae bacterium]|nr:hypothetical protein [Nocardioidaceae bacterium]
MSAMRNVRMPGSAAVEYRSPDFANPASGPRTGASSIEPVSSPSAHLTSGRVDSERCPSASDDPLPSSFLEDLSVEQTAELMGCSTGTVKKLTARALAGLRQLIGEDVEVPKDA